MQLCLWEDDGAAVAPTLLRVVRAGEHGAGPRAQVAAGGRRGVRLAFGAGVRDRDSLLQVARQILAAEPRAALDYLELRREGDLAELPAGPISSGRMLVAAKFVGGQQPVRLLDNLSLDDCTEPPVGSASGGGPGA